VRMGCEWNWLRSCPMMGFGIGGVNQLGSTTTLPIDICCTCSDVVHQTFILSTFFIEP
jgi:hypothetical protein